ncbi:NAD(P)-dependent oxidoreductase, partial [bacterium]|nr:NAD(P)-dependent oxidoreductase [bacterium]
MRILVTGSKGRVGSWVASAATAAGQVVIEYDLGAGQDILDREALAAAMDGCDGVVHTAARLGGT